MKDEIAKIRQLLSQIENQVGDELEESFKESFELFELPEIVGSIVDYLQPLLLPYEAAIYWYMFRHSILENGDVYVRTSVRGLTKNVVTSASGQSTTLSYGAVQDALLGLEKKGVIAKAGDTNREGTPYEVCLPEEIKLCQDRMALVQRDVLAKVDPKKELDFYNIKENRLKIFERDSYKCFYCSKQLTRFSATLDHIQPVTQGGDHSSANLVTACLHCNSQRASKPVMEAISEERECVIASTEATNSADECCATWKEIEQKARIAFPPGKRLAVTVHFPVEWWSQRDEDEQKNYYHEYGAKVGAWRLLDVFDRAGVKGTCHLSGLVAELFPELVREIVQRGHDVAGHGYDQSHPQRLADADEERQIIRKTVVAIEKATGYRPRGWVCTGRRISKNTVRILVEEGLLWHSNHDRGDLPSIVKVDGKLIVDCPIQRYMNFDERRFLGMDGKGPPLSCRQILEFFQSQIDALRGAAQYEPLCFQFGSHATMTGLPAYSWVLEQMLSYATSFDDIWLVTSTELAEYWLATNSRTTS